MHEAVHPRPCGGVGGFYSAETPVGRVLGNVPNIFTHRKFFLPLSITFLGGGPWTNDRTYPSMTAPYMSLVAGVLCRQMQLLQLTSLLQEFPLGRHEIIGNLQLVANFIIHSCR